MERVEHTSSYGGFRIVATATRTAEQGAHPNWDVRVSLWEVGGGVWSAEPLVLALPSERWSDPTRAISRGIAAAKERVDSGRMHAAPA